MWDTFPEQCVGELPSVVKRLAIGGQPKRLAAHREQAAKN